MTNLWYPLALLLLSLSVVGDARGELYKWVDEWGKVHYSDEQPRTQQAKRVTPIQTDKGPQGKSADFSGIQIKPYDRAARPLWLLDSEYNWRKSSQSANKRKIGSYHVGNGCTSRGAMTVPEAMVFHGEFFPSEPELAFTIRKVISELGYPADKVTAAELRTRVNQSAGLSLESEILNMEFKTCAGNLSSRDRLTPAIDIPARRFNRHRIKLSIHWTLQSAESKKSLFEGITVGEYSGWNKSASAASAILHAVEKATLELFSRPQFVDHILVDELPTTASLPGDSPSLPRTASPEPAQGSIGNIFVAKARLTQVLSDFAQVRMLLTQYYYERGHWPGNLAEIGLSMRDFADNKAVNDVIIHGDGRLIAELSSQFGQGRRLELKPVESGLGMKWRCASNLPKGYLPMDCESY